MPDRLGHLRKALAVQRSDLVPLCAFALLSGVGLAVSAARVRAIGSRSSTSMLALGVAMAMLGVAAALAAAVAERRLAPAVQAWALRFSGVAALFAGVSLFGAALTTRASLAAAASVLAALFAGAAVPAVLSTITVPVLRAPLGGTAVLVGVLVAMGALIPRASGDTLAKELIAIAISAAPALAIALERAAQAALRRVELPHDGPAQHRLAPRLARTTGPALLDIDDLAVSYGPVQVIFGASLRVEPGEAVALLGTNGAGKTTILRAISRLLPVAGGQVRFDGRDALRVSAEDLARHGLVMVPGGQGVFPTLSVADNLRVAGYRLRSAELRDAVRLVGDAFPALARAPHRAAGLLSGGEQQMLALSRAYLARAKLLAIDELSMGLAPVVVEQLVAFTRTLRERGVALLLVEQSVNIALGLCDRAYFLERGRMTYEGTTAQLRTRDDVLRSVFTLKHPSHSAAPVAGAV